ncbi:MAG TPA: tRNA pseudouridine(55) synthase TruB [Tepidisphaeraceae bacterium]|nr:tRNA pseudouridine(55) synthase TruB [Tepidisphaeraceae bacterium]
MTPGIHLLHKPVGPTSFSIVQACIESLGDQRGKRRTRICHGGTLDPFAHGLLLILVGQATKLFDHLHGVPKVYEAELRWGMETDNGDPLGRMVFQGDPSGLSPSQLDAALATFVGWREQVPPATSAKRIGGERAYERAHRGETVELPPSRVYLHEATWLGHDLPRASRLRIVVRGGYYVRSLARDIGRLLGCGAHLTALHRTEIGPWHDPGFDARVELHGRELLPWGPSRELSDEEMGQLRQAQTIPAGELIAPDWRVPPGFPDPDAPARAVHRGKLVFLLRREEDHCRPLRVLPGGL